MRGAKEIAQGLGTLAALTEYKCSIPSSTICKSNSEGSDALFWPLKGTSHVYGTCRQNIHMEK